MQLNFHLGDLASVIM